MLNELALFAGAGGGILGGALLGWRTVCAVEIDPYCAGVLVARQNDGLLPPFPIWDDIRTFDGHRWRGIVDVVSGGFPCQDISCAGKGDGLDGERSGLWREFARIVGEVRPRFVFVENSPMLVIRGGVRVLGDLAALGFSARWGVVSAADAGAPHLRERIWIVADAECDGRGKDAFGADSRGMASKAGEEEGGESTAKRPAFALVSCGEDVADADCAGSQGRDGGVLRECTGELPFGEGSASEGFSNSNGESAGRIAESWGECRFWESEPDVGRVANGVASRVDRLRALGNGQVPACAALAWKILA